jgi:hypothetical protein
MPADAFAPGLRWASSTPPRAVRAPGAWGGLRNATLIVFNSQYGDGSGEQMFYLFADRFFGEFVDAP